MNAVIHSAVLLLCLGTAGCAGPVQSVEAQQRFIGQQRAAAALAQREGDLARALNLWRSIAPLSQTNSEVSLNIARLEDEIAMASAMAKQKAEQAYQRGASRDGDRWLRQALALQPGDEQALQRLTQSYSQRAIAQLNSKNLEQLPTSIAAKPTAPKQQPANSSAQAATALQLQMEAANRARVQGDPEQELDYLLAAAELDMPTSQALQERVRGLRQDISERWYRQGTALFQANLPAAISALEKSLAYDPNNQAAQLKLKQARTLLQNLEKIQAGG